MKEEKENIYININKQIIEKMIYMATYLPMCMWMACIMKMWWWFKALIFFYCFGQFFDSIFSPKNYWIFTTKI